MKTAISEEGLRNHYGAEVGRTLLRAYGDDVKVRARAKAAAAIRCKNEWMLYAGSY